MSIPLVQNNEKDSINASIIAIKRQLERINMLLGLVDSGGSDPDLSGLATKQELQDAITELSPVDEVTLNNMQSVTSNAVAKCLSYSTTEHKTGRYYNGKPTYSVTLEGPITTAGMSILHNIANIDSLVTVTPFMLSPILDVIFPPFVIGNYHFACYATKDSIAISTDSDYIGYNYRIIFEYTKTSD